ncbi:peptidylprolyl isomerase [Roseivirga sp. BDSF3-8]|uniref:FKBP-type peptidyl-prolyl cis-trans isomerase n=1 Tax=Roseivirga sp. BDSF3-8 TaxID=3241598 RepID=UPI003531EC4B
MEKEAPLTIKDGRVVTLRYLLRENDERGQVLEVMDNYYPFEFLFGTGSLLPAFEDKLKGLSERDYFTFTLAPDEAYGQPQAENIIDVPMSAFEMDGRVPDGMLAEGQTLTLKDDQGDPHTGRVVEWNKETVKMDFNHVMTGKTLHFSGQVLHIREATPEELARNHHIPADGIRRD